MDNQQNRSMMKTNISGTKCVSYDKTTKQWQAYICIHGVRIALGKFTNIEDAKQARMIRENQEFGIFTHSCEKIF